MSVRSHGRRRIAARIGLAALLAIASLVPLNAAATTQTKFYSAAATWASNPAIVGVADTATFSIGNEPSSTQTFGSVELTFNTVPSSGLQVVPGSLPAGWSGKVLNGTPGVVLLTNSSAAIAPGHSLSVQVAVTPTAAGTLTVGTETKQSNNFSGTGNDFIRDSASGLSIPVVALSIRFAHQPSATIGQSLPSAAPPYFTYFCNPISVQTYNGASPVAAAGVPITLSYAGSSNPGLVFATTGGNVVNTDSTGLATFGSCASGVGATVIGTGFALKATTAAAAAPATSSSFQVLQTCIGTCTTNNNSNTTGTSGTVNAGDNGNVFQIFTAFGQGVVLNCDNAVTQPGTPVDPLFAITQTTAGTVSGTLTMVFPKSVVQSLTNNGTPLMAVCAGASASFPRLGDPTTGLAYPGSSAFPFQGLLYNCDDPTYVGLVATNTYPEQLCVQSRTRLGGSKEQIVVFAGDLSDPSFW